MLTGTTKWFNASRGYGFIRPDGGGPDVMVHAIRMSPDLITNVSSGAGVRVAYTQGEGASGRYATRCLPSRDGAVVTLPIIGTARLAGDEVLVLGAHAGVYVCVIDASDVRAVPDVLLTDIEMSAPAPSLRQVEPKPPA